MVNNPFKKDFTLGLFEYAGGGYTYKGEYRARIVQVDGNFRVRVLKLKKDLPIAPPECRYPSKGGLFYSPYIKIQSDYYPAKFVDGEDFINITPVTEGIKLWAHTERKRIIAKASKENWFAKNKELILFFAFGILMIIALYIFLQQVKVEMAGIGADILRTVGNKLGVVPTG